VTGRAPVPDPRVERLAFEGLPPVERLRVGDLSVTAIPDLDRVPWPCEALLDGVGPALLQAGAASLPAGAVDPRTGRITLSFNVVLVQAPGLIALVDPGVGADKDRPDRPAWHRRESPVLAVLARLGVAPDAVGLVINTHLHADHVGGNTVLREGRWVPAFPRARYVVPAADLAHWQARDAADPEGGTLHGAYRDSVEPLLGAGCLEPVDLPSEVAPGIVLEAAPGHSPGMATVRIARAGTAVRLLADAIHHPLQFLDPRIGSRFCADARASEATRARLLAACAEEEAIVLPYHFPAPAFGRVRRDANGFRYAPLLPRRDETDASSRH
jgi:glyoxylase-like metal-dependent hydrolase (beta-lactamase superfamily II)